MKHEAQDSPLHVFSSPLPVEELIIMGFSGPQRQALLILLSPFHMFIHARFYYYYFLRQSSFSKQSGVSIFDLSFRRRKGGGEIVSHQGMW